MPTALQKIVTRAKQIRKKKPAMQWKTAVKEASREYKSGSKKISGVKKKKSAGRPAGKRMGRIGAAPGEGSLSQAITATKKKLTEELGWLMVQHRIAKTKTAKKQYAAKIADLSKKLRALS